jgi:hypothetical protein
MKRQTRTVALIVASLGVVVVIVAMRAVSPSASLRVTYAQPAAVEDDAGGDGIGMCGPYPEPLNQNPCPDCGCNNTCPCTGSGSCVDSNCGIHACTGGPGGSNPPQPQPTHPPGGGNPGGGNPGGATPQATTVSGPAQPAVCGDGWCNGAENCVSCPRDCGGCYPTATPRPYNMDEEVTYHCVPWPDCPGGWADTTVSYHRPSGTFIVITVICLDEAACVPPTAVPGATPTPGTGEFWPCDYPPTVDGNGVIRQPCDDWPGWQVEAVARIPSMPVLRNPWPRGIVGEPNCFWYPGGVDGNENWSDTAIPCQGVDYGATYDEDTYDCGGDTGQVGQGAKVNYQIGVAWRRWKQSDGPYMGFSPPAEFSWVIEDREWNGGTTMRTGPSTCYTFETSSYGLEDYGPVWNPDCQEETCDCDERVLDYLGAESYRVNFQTWWYPEWTIRYDNYYCSEIEWGDCGCFEKEPKNVKNRRSCTAPPGICIQEGEWYGKLGHCVEWKWRRKQDAWTPYDLRDLGFANPLLGSTNVVVAGADAGGAQCGEFTDRWPCYIPVPVIELQPVAPGP